MFTYILLYVTDIVLIFVSLFFFCEKYLRRISSRYFINIKPCKTNKNWERGNLILNGKEKDFTFYIGLRCITSLSIFLSLLFNPYKVSAFFFIWDVYEFFRFISSAFRPSIAFFRRKSEMATTDASTCMFRIRLLSFIFVHLINNKLSRGGFIFSAIESRQNRY